MQLHQLRYVVKVSQLGSFSLAAKELFVSQPTLSQQIINLEKELGVVLFIRQSKTVILTPAGKDFVKKAKHILEEINGLSNHMKEFSALNDGAINVGIMWSASYIGLTEKINSFCELYPKIKVNLFVDGSHLLVPKLLDHEVDVILYINTDDRLCREDICQKKLIDNKMMVVLSKTHCLKDKEKINFDDLKREKLLVPSTDENLKQRILQYYSSKNITPQIFCESNLADVMIQFAGENKGVTFVSEMVAQNMLTEKVKMVALDPVVERPICFATRKEFLNNPAVAAFAEYFFSQY